jgi:WD40 repeat protein
MLATGDKNGDVDLWELPAGKRTHLGRHGFKVVGLAFLPNSKTLVSGGWEGAIKLWSIPTNRTLTKASTDAPKELDGWHRPLLALAVADDGKTLVSASMRTMRLRDIPNGETRREFPAGGAFALVLSKDGKLLASSSDDGKVQVWDTTTGRKRVTLSTSMTIVQSLGWSPWTSPRTVDTQLRV